MILPLSEHHRPIHAPTQTKVHFEGLTGTIGDLAQRGWTHAMSSYSDPQRMRLVFQLVMKHYAFGEFLCQSPLSLDTMFESNIHMTGDEVNLRGAMMREVFARGFDLVNVHRNFLDDFRFKTEWVQIKEGATFKEFDIDRALDIETFTINDIIEGAKSTKDVIVEKDVIIEKEVYKMLTPEEHLQASLDGFKERKPKKKRRPKSERIVTGDPVTEEPFIELVRTCTHGD